MDTVMPASVLKVFLVDDAADVRHRLARPSIVSIVLTNHCATAFRRVCEASGADFFFDKTSAFDMACRTIEAIANARRAHSA
jgi:hypothetical protein